MSEEGDPGMSRHLCCFLGRNKDRTQLTGSPPLIYARPRPAQASLTVLFLILEASIFG